VIQSKHLSTLIAAAVALWAAFLFFGGIAASPKLLGPFSSVTGALGLLLLAFDRWLWRIPLLHPWFVDVPDIRGIWRAEIRSNWIIPDTGRQISPIAGFMVIRQTYSTLSMRLITKESSSKLLAARILCDADGLYTVTGIYSNEPKHSLRERSPIHYGSLVLRVSGDPVTILDGHYWTDRKTQGELILSDHKIKYADDFVSATIAFQTNA